MKDDALANRMMWMEIARFFLGAGSFIGFVLLMSFTMARPIDELALAGKSLPAGWEAAYPNHGKYLRGYAIGSHPFAFAMTCILLFGSVVANWFVQSWIRRTRNNLHIVRSGTHKVVTVALILATIAFAFVIYRYVISGGVAPV